MNFRQWLYAPGKDRPIYLLLGPPGFLLVLSLVMLLAGGCRVPLPEQPVTPDEVPATDQVEECPCPDFAVTVHPEDPSEDGYCMTRSRTGQWMDAREHPQCRREAMERMGWGP